jgi:diguanylate cyclase (GGDEF)-like protein
VVEDLISINDDMQEAGSSAEPWLVICADDDPSAHRSTAFALEGELIEGRPVRLVSAYSAKEAIELVKAHPEAAALLLDVVMESPTAGLDAIATIRQELRRGVLRIIVRSGAPGLMGELETVKQFDITDWRPKNELNQSRLLSAITLAVRSFEELARLDKRSVGLDEAMGFLERLAKDPGSEKLMEDLLGAIEGGLDDSVWALGVADDGAWRLAAGPRAHAQGQAPWGWEGDAGADKVSGWLRGAGREESALERVAVSGSGLQASVWTSKKAQGEGWEGEQARALRRALRSALGGQEKARAEREGLLRDPVTGLLSRQGFLEKSSKAAKERELAVFLLDLAGFARINSALGHEAGDEMLRKAARRLEGFAGAWPCARIASDAFAFAMPRQDYDAQRLEELFEQPLDTSIIPVAMRPRVAATRALEGEDPAAWLTRAAAAMEEAKSAGLSGGEPRWFDPRSEALALERMEISQNLFAALRDRSGLFMVFQPQVALRDGQVIGCEALIRWNHNGALIPPDKFVPIAESSGLAMAISEFALSESLAMMRRARLAGLALPRVSVNLSPVEFEAGDLVGRVDAHLAKQGCLPQDLVVEVTETAAARDPERMGAILKGLRARGIKVAIDDFGSGYSSLAQLARLPIDELKIDRAFVSALGQTGPFSGIAKMIVDLASSMQLEVVAEGVELLPQATMLASMGAQSAQGWLFAKGMREEEMFCWLRSQPQTP